MSGDDTKWELSEKTASMTFATTVVDSIESMESMVAMVEDYYKCENSTIGMTKE